jgi:hypothetical protein
MPGGLGRRVGGGSMSIELIVIELCQWHVRCIEDDGL